MGFIFIVMVFRLTVRRWSNILSLSKRKGVLCRNLSSTIYPIHPGHVDGNHDVLYEESINNPQQFWGDLAKRRLRWMKKFDNVMDCDMNKGKISWFLGGKLNVSGNLVGVTSVNASACSNIYTACNYSNRRLTTCIGTIHCR